VKALARLDHRHVIRYFNAWLEIDEVLVTDDKLESNGDQQARFDTVKKSTKRPKIKEVREGESGNTSSLSSSPEVPPSLLSSYNLRTSMSAIDLKSTYFEDTLDSVAGEYSEECENQNQCLDLIPYNMPQHKFQRSLQTELSARFLKPTLDRTYDESVVEESFDFGHNTYEAKPVSTENHHVLSTQSKQQLVPKCVFSLFVRMQLCTKMTLQQWIEKPDRVIDLDDNLKIFKQIVLGLKHIHDMNIIHRDIKPSNIFLSHDGDFKIGDLGLAKDMTLLSYNPGSVLKNSLHTTNIGTATYAAPEQSAEKQTAYTNKVDIYSLGLILFEMFNQFASYHERAKTLNELRTFQMLPQVFETHWSAALCNLIKSMVSSKPEERLSCDEILGHPIMNRKIKASDAVLQLKEKLEEMAGENKRLLDIIKKQQEEIEVLKKLAQAGNG
jgi:serine/threonine protein kinase